MMAERQVVIVKAQDLIRTIDKLESYAENYDNYGFGILL
jgi:DNA polymerase-3 subunit delta